MEPIEQKTLIKVGFFILILLIFTFTFIFILGERNFLFEPLTTFYVEIPDAQNLRQGANVHLRGVRVGKVEELTFQSFNHIRLQLAVQREYLPFIKKDSRVQIQTLGVMGDKYVEIVGGSPQSPPIQEGDYLPLQEGFALSEIVDKGEVLLENSQKIISELESLLKNLNAQGQLSQSMKNLKSSTEELDQLLGQLNKILNRIQKGPGTLHSIIYDESLYQEAQSILQGAKRSTILRFFINKAMEKNAGNYVNGERNGVIPKNVKEK